MARSGEGMAPAWTATENATAKWLDSLSKSNAAVGDINVGGAGLGALTVAETAAGGMRLFGIPGAGALGVGALEALGPGIIASGLIAAGPHRPEGASALDVDQYGRSYTAWPGLESSTGMPSAVGAAPVVAKVDGKADVNITVEPSDSFLQRIVTAVTGALNLVNGGVGTSGSTGMSMPEAGPNP